MKHALICLLAIAGWYLLYPPAIHRGGPESYASLSQWKIDGSYATPAECDSAHQDDLSRLQGLAQNSPDFLQTKAGRCVASDDPRRPR